MAASCLSSSEIRFLSEAVSRSDSALACWSFCTRAWYSRLSTCVTKGDMKFTFLKISWLTEVDDGWAHWLLEFCFCNFSSLASYCAQSTVQCRSTIIILQKSAYLQSKLDHFSVPVPLQVCQLPLQLPGLAALLLHAPLQGLHLTPRYREIRVCVVMVSSLSYEGLAIREIRVRVVMVSSLSYEGLAIGRLGCV